MINLKLRSDVPVEYTWDTTALYPSFQAWEEALQTITNLAEQVVDCKGQITRSAPRLLQTLKLMDELSIVLERTASYARLNFDVDMGNPAAKGNYERIDNVYAKLSAELAFYEPELLELDPLTFGRYLEELPELRTYAFMFEKLFKEKEHILTASEEEILSRMGTLAGSFRKIFDDLTVLDLPFPEIDDGKGGTIAAAESNYRAILGSYDRDLRERYFRALLGAYGSHINSLASSMNGNLKYFALTAQTRKYNSAQEMSLQQNHIPLSVYTNLLLTVREKISLLHRYISFKKTILKYDQIHFYDLFVPLVQEADKTYTFEEAQKLVLEALDVLGAEYSSVLRRAFQERWIDVFPSKGKTPGAYASGIYSLHPYSLLNFSGTIDDIFTLAHELGHVMHSYYSNKNQPYVDSNYAIFTAEVASTVNEYLLYRHLLKRTTSEKEKAHLLSMHLDSIRSTLYRQTFFADFELQMHTMVAQDIPVTPELLSANYRKLYEFYHGADFTIDDELLFEWARIPHFYSPFYVYQYATGISAAFALAKRILSEKNLRSDAEAKNSYLAFLKAGGSDYPINLLKAAGVDLTAPTPILAVLEDFAETLTKLEQLV